MARSLREVSARILWGDEDPRIRATWRILFAFATFIVIYVAGTSVLQPQDRLPDILLNAAGGIVVVGAVAVTLWISSCVFDNRPIRGFGFDFDRQWWLDFFAAIGIGFVFQATVTVLFLQVGVAEIVGGFSYGVATDQASLALAVGATGVGFLSVALWEEFLFRGVLIRNAIEGLAARGATPMVAIGGAWMASILAFGLPHIASVAAGASGYFAVLQALLAGVYFGLAYLLTDSLAFPIGLHFATNFWVRAVAGQPGTPFPTLVQMERTIQLSAEALAVVAVSFGLLVSLILAWVYLTRKGVSTPNTLTELAVGPPSPGDQGG